MTAMLTIPEMPYECDTILYVTFDTKMRERGKLTSIVVTRVFGEAYRQTVAELIGDQFLSLAKISPEMDQGLFGDGDQIQYRMAIKCPDRAFGSVLDVNIRMGLVANKVDNGRIFSASMPFNTRDNSSFFTEDWNGFLEGTPYCRDCHSRRYNAPA